MTDTPPPPDETAGRLALGRILGGILHEFNNALGVVHGYSELLIEELPDPDSQDMVERIRAGAEQMQRLVRSIQKVVRRPMAGDHGPADLVRLVDDVVGLCKKSFQSDSVRLSVASSVEALPVEVDATSFQRVVLILLEGLRSGMVRTSDGGGLVVSVGSEEDKGPFVRLTPSVAGGIVDDWLPPLEGLTSGGETPALAVGRAMMQELGGRLECETSPTGITEVVLYP